MADDLKVPSFSNAKKLKTTDTPVPVVREEYVPMTDEQIESCRKGQDIFDFARDIEEVIRVNNRL